MQIDLWCYSCEGALILFSLLGIRMAYVRNGHGLCMSVCIFRAIQDGDAQGLRLQGSQSCMLAFLRLFVERN